MIEYFATRLPCCKNASRCLAVDAAGSGLCIASIRSGADIELVSTPMSLFDETAGSPVAGPSNGGSSKSDAAGKTRSKKRPRQSKRDGDSEAATTPVASSSQAVYAPPAAGVQRYSRGKAVSTNTVGRSAL